MPSHYEIERLIQRIASGTTTEKDARFLRRLLAVYSATDPVAHDVPQR